MEGADPQIVSAVRKRKAASLLGKSGDRNRRNRKSRRFGECRRVTCAFATQEIDEAIQGPTWGISPRLASGVFLLPLQLRLSTPKMRKKGSNVEGFRLRKPSVRKDL